MRDSSGKVFRSLNRELYSDGVPFPCGQCIACRINKRRVWTHRLMLESFLHDKKCFVTLTYQDKFLPSDLSVHKDELQRFIKRVRFLFSGRSVRYYAVGEYGGKFGRPHYHILFFGLGLDDANLIARCWYSDTRTHPPELRGRVQVDEFNRKTVQYVAGYVVSKIVKKEKDPLRQVVLPEFSIMSRKPPIGSGVIDEIVRLFLSSPDIMKHIALTGDIPLSLRHGSKLFPFGRFFSHKIRERIFSTVSEFGPVPSYLDFDKEKRLASFYDQWLSRFSMFSQAIRTNQLPPGFDSDRDFLDFFNFLNEQPVKNYERRRRIFTVRSSVYEKTKSV